MSDAKKYDVAICGAGIGGLTAAIALSQQGLNSVIVERMSTASAHGSGLQLGPNACHVLTDLGLIHDLKKIATVPDCIHVRDITSRQTITKIPLGQVIHTKYLAPYYVVHRKDLHAMLLKKVMENPHIEFIQDFPAEGFEEHGDRVDIISTRGQRYAAHVLIGADGLWSVVRKQLHGDSLPVNSGQIAWRATIPTTNLDSIWRVEETGLWLGKEKHLVTYPVKGGGYINMVAITKGKAPGLGWSENADKEDLLSIFKDAHTDVKTFMTAAPMLNLWQLHDREPLKTWGRARVSLLGDAAHPQLPHLAQGAAMAMEDAHVLARCLGAVKDGSGDALVPALLTYENYRKDRTRQVQQASREQVNNYQMDSLKGSVRNLVLNIAGRFMPEKLLAHYDWLYGANVVKDPSGSEV